LFYFKLQTQNSKDMNLIEKMNWRYATKRMNGKKIPAEKLDKILEAVRLAPTSFGLQPFKVIVVEDEALREQIYKEACQQPQIKESSQFLVFAAIKNIDDKQVEDFIQLIADTRGLKVESLNDFKAMFGGIVAGDENRNFIWTARQAYIAFGIGIVAAAMEDVDATPMEGFNADALDKILGLTEQNLSAVNILALGYRDEANDRLAKAAKVRKSKELLFDFR
jgi:nitroreductase